MIAKVKSLLFPDRSTAGPPPDIPSPPHQPFDRSRRRIEGWSNVEVEDRLARWLRGSRVIVDHIANLLRARGCHALDEPVVSVKWRFGAAKKDECQ